MELVNLTINEFEDFVNNNKYKSIYQTKEYARFLKENDFDYDYLGIKDKFDRIITASLIGYKKYDNTHSYGISIGGFLIDYKDTDLIKDYNKALAKYYKKKNIVFIKIIPNIIIGKLNKDNNEFIYNDNKKYIKYIKDAKLQPLKDNLYFESILPKYTPIIDLKKFQYNKLHKNTRNKIRKAYKRGLFIDKVKFDNIKDLYPFIKNKTKNNQKYYENLYRSFEPNIDVFLVGVNFEEYLINMKDEYEKELSNNNELIKKIKTNPTDKILDKKIYSDNQLAILKNNVVMATNGLAKGKKEYIAGCIVLKYEDKVIVYESGYNIKYKDCCPNYFLYYRIIEYYKYNYNLLDMNGFSGDLTKNNPYYGVNEFKLGFNADIYESIGEFDLILNKHIYKKISSDGTLSKLFNKRC